jgi:hypothetical protein
MVGQGDPTHVAGQVVSGIGFLGAGVILREGVNASRAHGKLQNELGTLGICGRWLNPSARIER